MKRLPGADPGCSRPRTVNGLCGPGASTAAYAATGSDASTTATTIKSFLLHASYVSHRPRQIPRAQKELPRSKLLACASFLSFPARPRSSPRSDSPDSLVGRSHECNVPARGHGQSRSSRPRASTPPPSRAPQIDRAVRDALADGRPLYAIDAELLERLAPDVIVTQDLCEVCAVPSGEVRRVAHAGVETISLDPRDLGEIEESIRTLARHLGVAARGEQLAQAMHHRIDGVRQAVRGLPRPRVFVAEWLDPPFAAGHWVPEMVALAGGEEVLGRTRERSFATTWEAVAAAAPHLIVLAPCGFDLERTVARGRRGAGARRARRRGRRRRRLLAPGPARRRGRRAARAPAAPATTVGAPSLAVAPARSRVAHIWDAHPMTVLAAPVGQPAALAASTLTGHSVRGRPITARRLGDAGDGPDGAGVGAIHGNERPGIAIVRRLAHDRAARARAPLGRARPQPRRRRRGHARQRPRRRPQPQLRLALAPAHGARDDVLRRAEAPLGAREPLRATADRASAAGHHDLVPPVGDAVDNSSGSHAIEARFARRVALPLRRLIRYPGQRHDLAGAPLPEGDGVRRRAAARGAERACAARRVRTRAAVLALARA